MNCLSRKEHSYLVNAHCEVEESNVEKREGCYFAWLDLVMETRPEQNTTLSENMTRPKESYTQRQVDHFLVQRSLDQRIRMGRLGQRMEEYHLPYRNVLPVPMFVPWNVASLRDSQRTPTPELERGRSNGLCADKKDVSEITKDIPKVVQPSRVDFRASLLISPPGESIRTLQRR
ncbi:telethonin [Paramormyrops kingsleyae]|uniref:Telethonin-like n=1 Tax=Paramormyrops kingsleyae TaxID=1676925 RepID=A0A3B3R2K4_9TELE|nr:telethonin-like [Paramormyrops kingsleyae]